MEFKMASAFFIFSLFLISVPLISSENPHSPHSHHIKPSPFAFLKHLQGCHKGDNINGVHDLKNYLHNFGYLSYDAYNHSHHHIDDDVFDDELELALRTYQDNYHLKATGVLDSDTIAQMSMPRCGVADIVNGTTRMRSSKKNHHDHRKNGHFHTVSHYSFFPGFLRWRPSKSHLTYAFLPSVPTVARAPVTQAFNDWATRTHFRFSETSNTQSADLKISFERGNHGDGAAFDGLGGVIAHAFAPEDGRFHYDGDERFGVGVVPGAYDLKTVALHEIGHLLGLGHSSVQGAIMWPNIATGAVKGLHNDDIAGIRALYRA